MDDFLTPVSQTYLKPKADGASLSDPGFQKVPKVQDTAIQVASLSDVLDTLKGQPGYDNLIAALEFASKGNKLSNPNPETAQIIQLLASDTVPNYWPLLRDGQPKDRYLFLGCLRNIASVNALLSRLKSLIQEAKASERGIKRPDIALGLDVLLQVLAALLDGDRTLSTFWHSAQGQVDGSMKTAVRQEFLSLFARSGKIISVSAEADAALRKERGQEKDRPWAADGLSYTKWLGRNISTWLAGKLGSDDDSLCAEIFVRALRLGYGEHLIKQLIEDLLLGPDGRTKYFLKLYAHLSQLEQKRVLYAVLKHLAESFLNKLGTADTHEATAVVAAAAGVIEMLVENNESRKNHLVVWLSGATGAGLGDSVGIRRAVLAALANDREAMVTVLEKGLNQFGDELYIRHSPTLQQEAHAQVVLLSAGYVHRSSPLKIKMLTRSGGYLQAVSNRLSTSQTKARLLGMAIGEALSLLSQTTLDFQMDELKTDEFLWYKSLTQVSDRVGPIASLVAAPMPQATKKQPPPQHQATNSRPARPIPPRQTGFVIEEVDDSDEDEDADLAMYNKPEYDPEDSDEDATMVRRDKPKPPVYIRDLITYLRDTENYDKQKLALDTAPTLIRRKANYGTEVSEHADELATLLVGLQDKFEMKAFYESRLQGMIALVIAQPKAMGPWFAKTFFDGDYSISQRASILIVLGLGAREVAGFDVSEHASAASFPSKRLPERMERLYLHASTSEGSDPSRSLEAGSNLKALPSTALDTIAQDLTSGFLAPLAANAADAATGPDVLKLSTFNSRLNAQGGQKSTSKKSAKTRLRAIPNTTASLLAACFFAPLTARFQLALRSPASRRHGSVVFQPYLLSLYLKTLALLIHAAGPSTLSLPQMTTELWDLLLGVRSHVSGDMAATHALLVALAAMLEVNDSTGEGIRRLCAEMPREVVETSEWVSAVFNGIRGEGGGEESQVKTLAAGVLITLQEAMEKYRALLIGDMMGP